MKVRGTYFTGDVQESVRTGSIGLSESEVSTLNLTVADPTLYIAGTRLFDPGGLVTYGGLGFRIQSAEIGADSGVPQLVVVARSEKVQALRRQKGAKVWKNRSAGQVVTELAKSVGLVAKVKADAVRPSISRGKSESSWTLITRLAEENKCLVFESLGVLYFGRLAGLVALTGLVRRTVAWDREGIRGTGDLVDVPNVRRSEDSAYAAEVTFTVMGPTADLWRLGDIAVLEGMPGYDGDYLVVSVDIPLSEDAVTVTARAAKVAAANTANPGKAATAERFLAPALRNTTQTDVTQPEAGTYDATALIVWAASQVGVTLPTAEATQLLAFCRNRGTTRTVAQAVGVRGALLFNDRRAAISLGDGRVIEATSDLFVVSARSADTWTVGALIPQLIYPKGA